MKCVKCLLPAKPSVDTIIVLIFLFLKFHCFRILEYGKFMGSELASYLGYPGVLTAPGPANRQLETLPLSMAC